MPDTFPDSAYSGGHPAASSTAGLHLSPSILHKHLLDNQTPDMAYSGGEVTSWQSRLRPKVVALLGDLPEQRPELDIRSLWTLDHPLGTIEKIAFTSEPFSDTLAYVCLPNDVKPPYTFFICVQGHSTGAHNSVGLDRDDNSKTIQVENDRDTGLFCLRNGIAALCIEQRSFGERRELAQEKVANQGCHDAAMHALMLGRTLIGERVYDVDRGIDYLAQRGDCRMDHIGVMGNSGGGTISLFAAAVLPRVAYAMPSCYFCTFRDSLMSIYHCSDNYVPGLLKHAEMSDVMGLFAPKPVVLVAGEKDDIFPIAGTREAFEHLQSIYAAAGAPDNCRLIVGPAGHRFYGDLGWSAMLDYLG